MYSNIPLPLAWKATGIKPRNFHVSRSMWSKKPYGQTPSDWEDSSNRRTLHWNTTGIKQNKGYLKLLVPELFGNRSPHKVPLVRSQRRWPRRLEERGVGCPAHTNHAQPAFGPAFPTPGESLGIPASTSKQNILGHADLWESNSPDAFSSTTHRDIACKHLPVPMPNWMSTPTSKQLTSYVPGTQRSFKCSS